MNEHQRESRDRLPQPEESVPAGKDKPRSRLALDRTLYDLESALNEWDAITSQPAAAAPTASPAKKADEAEFKRRTKLLLDELRRQLEDL